MFLYKKKCVDGTYVTDDKVQNQVLHKHAAYLNEVDPAVMTVYEVSS